MSFRRGFECFEVVSEPSDVSRSEASGIKHFDFRASFRSLTIKPKGPSKVGLL